MLLISFAMLVTVGAMSVDTPLASVERKASDTPPASVEKKVVVKESVVAREEKNADLEEKPPEVVQSAQPQPCHSQSVQGYLAEIMDNFGNIGGSFTEMSGLMQRASENPGLIRNDNWIFNIAAAFYGMTVGATKIEAIAPVPEIFKGAHSEALAVASLARIVTELLTDGIDNLDLEKLESTVPITEQMANRI